MTPVRVCFVIDNLSRAGTETQLVALLRGLDRSQVTPTLVLLDGDNAVSRSLEPDCCDVIRLGVRRLLGVRSAVAAARLFRLFRRLRPDVVQAYFHDPAYFAIPLARLAGVPTVLRVRNNLGYWPGHKHRLLTRLLGPLVSGTLTNTTAGRDVLVNRDRVPARKVTVIENGVDVDRFAACPPPDTSAPTVRIGCVANLRPVKNIDGLMRAAKLVLTTHPHVRFAVAGDGDQRPALESLRDSLDLGDRFELVGPTADVPGFLATVAIAVLPSHSEGMSNALLEYMAAGRAVVATDVGGNRGLLADSGLLVPPGDAAALAAGLVRLLSDPAYAQRLGATARRRVAEQYGRTAMARRFEAFYTSASHRSSEAIRAVGRHGLALTTGGPAISSTT